ncbi:MAG: addiction module protein [Planctomycetes bacterium]|jgi:putative addiction module component (TIGR02574 family)|nr:addiction module protein [Planctomycetota bacterium]
MSPETDRVLAEALKLPPEARAALAGKLIESLDDEVDPEAEKLWAIEIERRLSELDSGSVRPISWAAARRSILGPR